MGWGSVKFWPYLLGGIALTSGGLVLLVSGPFSREVPFARSVFCLSLIAALVAAGALSHRKQWLPAGLLVAFAANFLFLSFGQWYVEHWTPGPTGGSVHRHTLWELGHVH